MADALVITGPTASGKSALAMAVAERLDGEIISMDSRQVYRGLDIGTAKPDAADLSRIQHHGIDLIEPGERYSAGQFARDARKWIGEIKARSHTPIVAGGTLFFLRALQEPLFDEPTLEPVRRDMLRVYLNGLDMNVLRAWAAAVTPDATLPVDRQRLARLVEIATLTGRPLSGWHQRTAPEPGVETVVFVMTLGRTELYRRIDERVHEMVRNGFVEEVRGLVGRGYGSEHPGMNATGYQELVPHVAGSRSLEEAVALIQAASRQYARRQLTWLRTQVGENQNVHELDATLPVAQLVDRVEAVWRQEAA
jgi:tRNA dimethylallyltransferase